MFTEKRTQIFDKDVLKKGSIVTLAAMDYDYTEDDGFYLFETHYINGLIKACEETYFSIVLYTGDTKAIKIENMFKGDDTDGQHTKYKLVGIASKVEEVK